MNLKSAVTFGVSEWRFRKVYRKYQDFTMVPRHYYVGSLHLAKKVQGLAGAIVECGTWRGGMIAGMAEVLGNCRSYYLCDSFRGLPPARQIDGEAARAWQDNPQAFSHHNNCTASIQEARAAMEMSPSRDYTLVEGWFEDTLPRFPNVPIALLRMDADWYESTKCILDNLVKRLVPGGLIVIDDYYTWEGCTVAVNEYAARYKWQIRQNHHGVCYIAI